VILPQFSSGGNTSGFMNTSTSPRATLAPKLLPAEKPELPVQL
jgi:hypothetical protein